MLLGEALQPFDHIEVGIGQGVLATLAREPGALRRGLSTVVFAGEQTAGQRKVGQLPEPEALAGR